MSSDDLMRVIGLAIASPVLLHITAILLLFDIPVHIKAEALLTCHCGCCAHAADVLQAHACLTLRMPAFQVSAPEEEGNPIHGARRATSSGADHWRSSLHVQVQQNGLNGLAA